MSHKYRIDYNNYYTQITSIEDNINYNPQGNERGVSFNYKKSWYCYEKSIIHGSLNEVMQCKDCTPIEVRQQYTAQQRLKNILKL